MNFKVTPRCQIGLCRGVLESSRDIQMSAGHRLGNLEPRLIAARAAEHSRAPTNTDGTCLLVKGPQQAPKEL